MVVCGKKQKHCTAEELEVADCWIAISLAQLSGLIVSSRVGWHNIGYVNLFDSYGEDLYPNPKQFLPERFIERSYSPYEFIPFGGGDRLCVGYALAMLEMKLVLGSVLSRYQQALANNQPVKPKRRGPAVSPSDGVPMIMKGKRVAKAECGNAGSTNPPVLTSDRSYR